MAKKKVTKKKVAAKKKAAVKKTTTAKKVETAVKLEQTKIQKTRAYKDQQAKAFLKRFPR